MTEANLAVAAVFGEWVICMILIYVLKIKRLFYFYIIFI